MYINLTKFSHLTYNIIYMIKKELIYESNLHINLRFMSIIVYNFIFKYQHSLKLLKTEDFIVSNFLCYLYLLH